MTEEHVWEQVTEGFARLVDGGGGGSPWTVAESATSYGFSGGGDMTALALREAVRSGVPWAVLEAAKAAMGWSDAALARFLRVSEKTLQRSRTSGKAMGEDAAEKILDLSGVLMKGLEVFGEWNRFSGWLRTPGLWFENGVPEELLFDAIGRGLVREALDRVSHGIWN